IQGDSSIGGYEDYNGNTGGGRVTEGKSLKIIGNDHTLHLNTSTDDSSYANGTGAGLGYRRGAFRAGMGITTATRLEVSHATIINNITGGIFQAVGYYGNSPDMNTAQASSPTFVYDNVTVSNGSSLYAAMPIRNDEGKVLFTGTNKFSMLQNHNFNDASNSGADNQGEWIQGGAWTEIVNGTTTVEQSWGNDQPLYGYGHNNATLKVDDGANLNWNLNKTYTMYYDDWTKGALTWDIGNNASFIINGTTNTATNFAGGWWMWLTYNAWNLNVGTNGRFIASSGGGVIGLGDTGWGANSFSNGPVKWNFAQGSEVLFNNLNTGNNPLLVGKPGAGSGVAINDAKTVTLNTVGGAPVFATSVINFPITINGNGLRTHSSKQAAVYDASYSLQTPNETKILNDDIWYRQNTGTISGLGTGSPSNSLTPNPYSGADMTTINSAKYISWYQPIGVGIYGNLSDMSRTYDIGLGNLPADGTLSTNINGKANQTLVVRDDRGQKPNYNVTIAMTNLNMADKLNFAWVDPVSATSTDLTLNQAQKIASVSDDATLPAFISQAGGGAFYTMTFNTDKGLQIKANNKLKLQTNANAGTFKYSINNGI
ncbi:MAG: RTX toxin, partial [Streptococcaceae bacterium]|nr:RTX toxin [Streptococcaceae bacterium]